MAVLYRGPGSPSHPGEYAVGRTVGEDAWMTGSAAAWQAAMPVAWGPDRYRTTFRAATTTGALLLRFDCRDERPWHTKTVRDDRLWEEEVVEIFLDPTATGRGYAEIEISPANVVCDLRITEVRPRLVGDVDWDFEGLATRVQPWSGDHAGPAGWTALASLPWAGFRSLSPGAASRVPPAAGDRWRFNVFRIKRPHGPADPERDAVYAAWSVPPGPTFHVPEAFGTMVFS